MEHYAHGVPGAKPLLAELVLVQRRAGEVWDERTRKGVFAAALMAVWSETDLRASAPLIHCGALQQAGRRRIGSTSRRCEDALPPTHPSRLLRRWKLGKIHQSRVEGRTAVLIDETFAKRLVI